MIVCPNCNHQNPDGAVQCEACYTPLPAMIDCPSCGASVQADASFCGQCGFDLRAAAPAGEAPPLPPTITPDLSPDAAPGVDLEASFVPDPLVPPDPLLVELQPPPPVPAAAEAEENLPSPDPDPEPDLSPFEPVGSDPPPPVSAAGASGAMGGHTQLQTQTARLLHVQTNTILELPQNLSVIHIGKPNDRIPPDIDVAGFPNSEIVSRIHADIRIEGDTYYIEDVGSSNGTYINNTPLAMGNRHRLRPGDRIALGKGDQVTFLFQLS
jgi:pSer/pThr/pTyr-binding forkhead associated (FHA) protein